MLDHLSHAVARIFDGLSLGAIAATLLGWLPHIASILGVIWFGIRIANEILERKIKLQEFRINERKLAEPAE